MWDYSLVGVQYGRYFGIICIRNLKGNETRVLRKEKVYEYQSGISYKANSS